MNESYRITLLPGDGTGPEIIECVKKIADKFKINIEWEIYEVGVSAIEKYGTPLPDCVLDSIKKNRVALKGPVTTPIGGGFRSVNVELRQKLDLFACLRPCKLYPGLKSKYENVDLTVVRENTEDLYVGVEFKANSEEAKKIIELSGGKIKNTSAISIKPISMDGSKRIIKFAFDYARKNKRRKVTAITKANIMKYTDGIFFEAGKEISKEYPEIEYEEKLIDNMCMQLVQKPHIYDVLVLPNLYGDILSDLCAGLVGGLGVTPGANYGDNIAVFEPVHGSAPKYKGMNKVNPTATLLSFVMLLEYIGEKELAVNIERAISEVIMEGKYITYDLGGNAGTTEMVEEIIKKYENKNKRTLQK